MPMNFTMFGWLNWLIMIASVRKSRMQDSSAFLILCLFSLSTSGFGVLSSSNFTSTLFMSFFGWRVWNDTNRVINSGVWARRFWYYVFWSDTLYNTYNWRRCDLWYRSYMNLYRDTHFVRFASFFVIPAVYHSESSFADRSRNHT